MAVLSLRSAPGRHYTPRPSPRSSEHRLRESLLNVLACPACGGDLALEDTEWAADGSIREGSLVCQSCTDSYGIHAGVPVLIVDETRDAADGRLETAEAFAFAWSEYPTESPYSPEQISDWIKPLEPADFAGRVVLDAGCGTGAFAAYATDAGAAMVVAFDLNDAVGIAHGHAATRPNMHVVRADIFRPPFKPNFDLVYSIGVIHHLPDPREGFLRLTRLLRPEGLQFVWVYAWEGNGFIRRVIDPLRRATPRLPRRLMRWGVAGPLAAVLWIILRAGYSPGAGPLRQRLFPFYRQYLTWLATSSFSFVHGMVFDQLVAPTTHYIRGDDVREWFRTADLRDVSTRFRNANSWSVVGRRAA
jgi:SAM-dependent methyltransferase